MSNLLTSRKHAEGLARYFQAFYDRNPSDKYMEHGLRLANEYLCLMDSPRPTQARVDRLLQALDQEQYRSGTGWCELELCVVAWAKRNGFTVRTSE